MKKVLMVRRRKLGATSCREIAAQSKHDIHVWRNDQPLPVADPTMAIRWGCTANVPTRNVLNTAKAIHEVNDKLGFRRKLNEKGLCPTTWFDTFTCEEDIGAFGEHAHEDSLHRPVVVRPSKHAQGRNLDVCRTPQELDTACRKYPEFYISELIEKVAEYRVFVVQGRVACVAQKTPGNPEDVAWNVAKGGRFDNVRWGDWPEVVLENAVKSFNQSSLDFGGVDVMVDANGRAYTLEINSAPSLTSPYRQSCMAKCFDWIIDNGKERMMHSTENGWRGYVHPAISDKAYGVPNKFKEAA